MFAHFCEDAPPPLSLTLHAKNTDKTGGKKNLNAEIEKHPAEDDCISEDCRAAVF